MSARRFTTLIGAAQGVFFFLLVFMLIHRSADDLRRHVNLLLMGFGVAVFIGWQSFRTVDAIVRRSRSFIQCIAMGAVSGAVLGALGSGLIYVWESRPGTVPLSEYPYDVSLTWLGIGAAAGLIYACATWMINVGIVGLVSRLVDLQAMDNTARTVAGHHKRLLVSTLVMVGGLLAFTVFRHGWTPAPRADARPSLTLSANDQGLYGATDSQGHVIIPYQYAYAERRGDQFVVVMALPNGPPGAEALYGVLSIKGKTVLPLAFNSLEYHQDHRRFKVSQGQEEPRFGYVDEQGKVVVPLVYERLDRISNMGHEPTNVAVKDGKHGYLNLVTGDILIEPFYDELQVYSELTDAQGEGIALARQGQKWGVLTTRGQALTAFEYDTLKLAKDSSLVGLKDGRSYRWEVDGSHLVEAPADAPTP